MIIVLNYYLLILIYENISPLMPDCLIPFILSLLLLFLILQVFILIFMTSVFILLNRIFFNYIFNAILFVNIIIYI